MIREDISKIIELTKVCATNMILKNIFQWNELQPNKTLYIKDLN